MRAKKIRLAALGAAGLMLATAPAMAQPTTVSNGFSPGTPATTPLGTAATPGDTETISNVPVGQVGQGIASAQAVNPAPGATGPYLGVGENAFYHVRARIDRVEQMAKAQLSGSKLRRALADIKSVKAEVATQEARHGDLRDWDRENLNHRLNRLEAEVGISPPAQGE